MNASVGTDQSPVLIRSTTTRWIVPSLLAVHWLLAVSSVSRKCTTYDEIYHLTSGISIWKTGDYRLSVENPPLAHLWAALPANVLDVRFPDLNNPLWWSSDRWRLGAEFFYGCGNDLAALLLSCRATVALLSVGLGALVWWWSTRLFGGAGGLLALVLYASSPTMLAHAGLVTTDMAVSLFFLLAMTGLWHVLHRVSISTVAFSAAAVGGLVLSKMSAWIILPMAALIVLVRLISGQPTLLVLTDLRQVSPRLRQVAIWFPVAVAHAVIVALLIWAAYGFRYEAMKGAVSGRDRLYTFSPPPPGVDAWSHEVVGLGAIGRVIAWFRQHGLLPEAYLYGLVSTQKHIQEVPVFLNGEIHADGCWYFLPYCFAVKTALPLLALLLLALWGGGAAKARRQHVEGVAHRFSGGGANSATIASPTAEAMGHPDPAAEAMGHPDCGDGLSHTISRWRAIGQGAYRTAPLWSLLLVYTVFAIGSRVSLGHRHLLPIYPVLFIFAGRAVIWLRSPRPLAGWAALSAAGLFIGASLSVWPDYLAYFNYAAGGPADGYKHLVDSSLDWGQDLPGLRRWLDRQMGAAGKRAAAGSRPPVYLAYFGTGSPGFYGIRARTLMRYPGWDAPWASPLSGGIYCISATLLQQFHLMPVSKWTPALEACYQELDRGTPASRPNPSTRGAGSAGPAGLSGAELGLYLRLRFARLCACLRQRSPDHEIGHSILIYRLTDDDVRQALEGPPAESEPDSVHQLRDLAEWCFAGGCLRSAGVLYGEWARRLESLGPNPERADGMANYAACLASSGREADAVQAIRQGLRCDPNHVGMNTQLAWLLAGSRSDALRDGPEALRRATKAVEETGGRQPMVLASLAAAYAELGRFEEACRHAQDALRIAQDKRMTVPARQIAAQLELYRSGKPYRAL